MKFAFAFLAVALAASDPALKSEMAKDGHFDKYDAVDGVINSANPVSHRNYITQKPTQQPTVGFDLHKNPEGKGNLDAQIDQTDRVHQPTARPTAFPTKDTADVNGKGTVCQFTEGSISFTKPVGWVGAGPAQYYCNVWRCESNTNTFTRTQTATFKAARRTCSIEQYNYKFCSHTTCELKAVTVGGETRQVIRVHSDHREEVGGEHKCGFARHDAAQTAGRPACDCVCHGQRKQDFTGFARGLNEFGTFTATSREALNSNNFYSQHSNLDYNEKDQTYTGQRIAHAHRDE
jgi:hypothetical protein